MKIYTSLAVIFVIFSSCQLQGQNRKSQPVCCEEFQGKNGLFCLAVQEAGKSSKKSFLTDYYGINPSDSIAEVTGVIKIYGSALTPSCQRLFEALNHVEGNIYSFSIQLRNLKLIENHPEIAYISLSRMAETQLGSAARKDAGIDKVHDGVSIPMPYTGKGIICGLVDVSIDYTHPAFRNENGDSLRIIRAWAQNLNKGNRPSGYNYGVEFIGTPSLLAIKNDSIVGLHGTITAGCMAGGGFGSGGFYKGSAPDSKIIAITSNYSERSLLDAMKYFFTTTRTMNKKGVFNLSWGSHIGPHDGTSLFDQAIDSIVKEGGLIVGAAGNWAGNIIHLKHSSGTPVSSTSSVILQWDTVRYSLIDIWGKPNSSFQVQIKAIDKTTGKIVASSANVSTLRQGQSALNMIVGKDTTTVYLFMTAKDVSNNRSNCFVAFLHNHIKTNTNLGITISSVNNEVHAWGGNSAIFSGMTEKNILVPGYVAGDNQYTVGELGGTSKSIITVGAHVPHQKIRNIIGQDRYYAADSGKIEPFSSYGPTLDGRVKPDLTAPGAILAPVNSYEFDVNGSERFSVVENSGFNFEGKTYYWMAAEATSFSSPVVAGCVALLLEADPTLTYTQVKNALLKNTTTDVFTGNVALSGSPVWGYGKLNIHKAISSLVTVTGNPDYVHGQTTFWYSNPIQNTMTVFSPEFKSKVNLSVYDMYGRALLNPGISEIAREGSFIYYNTSLLKEGQYMVVLKTEEGFTKTVKLTKVN